MKICEIRVYFIFTNVEKSLSFLITKCVFLRTVWVKSITQPFTTQKMQHYISQLNEAQQQPVLQKDGPMIIIAGAGSG